MKRHFAAITKLAFFDGHEMSQDIGYSREEANDRLRQILSIAREGLHDEVTDKLREAFMALPFNTPVVVIGATLQPVEYVVTKRPSDATIQIVNRAPDYPDARIAAVDAERPFVVVNDKGKPILDKKDCHPITYKDYHAATRRAQRLGCHIYNAIQGQIAWVE